VHDSRDLESAEILVEESIACALRSFRDAIVIRFVCIAKPRAQRSS
jgi:hypothetical protein